MENSLVTFHLKTIRILNPMTYHFKKIMGIANCDGMIIMIAANNWQDASIHTYGHVSDGLADDWKRARIHHWVDAHQDSPGVTLTQLKHTSCHYLWPDGNLHWHVFPLLIKFMDFYVQLNLSCKLAPPVQRQTFRFPGFLQRSSVN